jgi:uncharacterized protein YlxP (DUF503 family)
VVQIGYIKLNLSANWINSLKDRRQVAQKLRDKIKNDFNASVKLIYPESIRTFELYIVLLSDASDYIYQVSDQIEATAQTQFDLNVTMEVDVDRW